MDLLRNIPEQTEHNTAAAEISAALLLFVEFTNYKTNLKINLDKSQY